MDKLEYYKIWKSLQNNPQFIESHCIPLVFPKNYLTIKRRDIKNTEEVKVMDKLYSIADNIHKIDDLGSNIYLYSKGCGNGKTMWSTIFAHKYVYNTGKRAYFVKDEDLHRLAHMLSSYGNVDAEDTLDMLLQVPLLVIDDLGTLELNKQSSILYHKLIDVRIRDKNPTIYTSNLTKSQLESQLSIKLASRIWNTSILIEFMGIDVREVLTDNPFE